MDENFQSKSLKKKSNLPMNFLRLMKIDMLVGFFSFYRERLLVHNYQDQLRIEHRRKSLISNSEMKVRENLII